MRYVIFKKTKIGIIINDSISKFSKSDFTTVPDEAQKAIEKVLVKREYPKTIENAISEIEKYFGEMSPQ